jgi:hypothetical protein
MFWKQKEAKHTDLVQSKISVLEKITFEGNFEEIYFFDEILIMHDNAISEFSMN